MEELTYEELVNEKTMIANIIWGAPFLTGVKKLNKKQLLLLVECLVEQLDFYENLHGDDFMGDERDFKDIIFDQKCLIIKACDSNFFKNKDKEKTQ